MDATLPDPRDSQHRLSSRFRESAELADLSFSARRPHRPEYVRITSTPAAGEDNTYGDLGSGGERRRAPSLGLGIGGAESPVSPPLSPERTRAERGFGGSPPLGRRGDEEDGRGQMQGHTRGESQGFAQADAGRGGRYHRSPSEGFESATTTPGMNQPFLSPETPYGFQGQSTEYRGGGGYRGIDASMHQQHGPEHFANKPSVSSYNSDHLYDPYLQRSPQKSPPVKFASEPSRGNTFPQMGTYAGKTFDPRTECPSQRSFLHSATKVFSITLYLCAVISLVLSGMLFIVAVMAPTWPSISNKEKSRGGGMTPGQAIILTSILAKIVELTFVTSFVAFLGQALSRSAFNMGGRGISLAEMNMRSWITQPGTLMTHWETVKYAGLTRLGLLSLLAALMATLYTPAATALVQPQLKFTDWEPRVLQGFVKTEWGDQGYVASRCNTPQTNDVGDPGNSMSGPLFQESSNLRQAHLSCLQVEYAAQSYHNYIRYFKSWTDRSGLPPQPQDMQQRPPGVALWEDKTEVIGSWIDVEDVPSSSAEIDRTVHKVHLAMPHVGVMQAATNEVNGILQPKDLDGQGRYQLIASVPSPVVHVTCAHLKEEDLSPLVYSAYPGLNETEKEKTIAAWSAASWGTLPGYNETAYPPNATIMDDLFGWSGDGNLEFLDVGDARVPNASDLAYVRPAFPVFPKPGNTLLNQTGYQGRHGIYLLGTAPRPVPNITDIDEYIFCSIHTTLTGACSTYYAANGENQGLLQSQCEDENNPLQFDRKYPENTTMFGKPNLNWFWMASEWGNAINFNDGIQGGGSNSRILTHLALKQRELNASMPSPSEALAVLASTTLLLGMQDTQMKSTAGFPYPAEQLRSNSIAEDFDTDIRAQLYTSGAHSKPSRAFMPVLFTVFMLNILVCLYFIVNMHLVTDFSEPPNMFAIALNSPPSALMAGACGGGPAMEQYKHGWRVHHVAGHDNDHVYLVPGDPNARRSEWLSFRRRGKNSPEHGLPHEHVHHYPHHSHLSPEQTPSLPNSPFSVLYDKFSKRKSYV